MTIISSEGLTETADRAFNEFKNSVSGFKRIEQMVEGAYPFFITVDIN